MVLVEWRCIAYITILIAFQTSKLLFYKRKINKKIYSLFKTSFNFRWINILIWRYFFNQRFLFAFSFSRDSFNFHWHSIAPAIVPICVKSIDFSPFLACILRLILYWNHEEAATTDNFNVHIHLLIKTKLLCQFTFSVK